MKFSDVIGQQEVKARLLRSVGQGRVSHAQMLSGKAGYGTLPLALAYIQYLNCTGRRTGTQAGNDTGGEPVKAGVSSDKSKADNINANVNNNAGGIEDRCAANSGNTAAGNPESTISDSCGVCPSCRKISALAHPDLHFIFPTNAPKGSGGSQKPSSDSFMPQWRELAAATGGYFEEQDWYDAIGLDNQQGIIAKREADEIIRKLSFKPFEAEYKAAIIWLPEKMGEEAANSLLKIIEEPWDKTLFLLVSESPQRLLSTILSRVQQTSVPPIETDILARYAAEKFGAGGQAAQAAARLSGGSITELRKLLAAADEENVRENFEYFAQLMRYSYGDRHLELLQWAEEMAARGRENQKRFLEYSTAMLRESYMLAAGMEDISYLWGGEMEFCRKFAPYIGNHNIEQLAEENRLALLHVTQNGNPKIIFTHYALAVSKMIHK